jgi:hypothetical protein
MSGMFATRDRSVFVSVEEVWEMKWRLRREVRWVRAAAKRKGSKIRDRASATPTMSLPHL